MFQFTHRLIKDFHEGITSGGGFFFHVPSKFTSEQIKENPVGTIIYNKLCRNLYKILNHILFEL